MAYIDIFRKRSSSLNFSSQSNDYFSDELLRSLTTQLASSPNSVTAVIDSVEHQIILASKSNSANKDLKNVSALNEAGLAPGSVFEAVDENWLVLQQDSMIVGDYFKGVVVRTNYNLKWIDIYGVIHESRAFITGSMSSFVRSAYETTPFYIETTSTNVVAILPSDNLRLHDKLIFNNKAWNVIDIDNESIQGLAFVSLEDVPVNNQLDNLTLGIANYYAERNWTIELQNNDNLELLVAETATLVPVVKLNGEIQSENCYIITTSSLITVDELDITGVSLGSASLSVALVNNPTILQVLNFSVVSSKSANRTVYISGDSYVKPTQTYVYVGYQIDDGVSSLADGTFSTDADPQSILASVTVIDTNSISVNISEDANIGDTATLRFASSGDENTITITVESFWI